MEMGLGHISFPHKENAFTSWKRTSETCSTCLLRQKHKEAQCRGGSFTSDFISRSEYHNMLLSLPDDEKGYVVVGGRMVI